MKFLITMFLLLVILLSFSCKVFRTSTANLNKVHWIHGSSNCKEDTGPPIQVVRYNYNTWILRQNRCINYEAPFLFLLFGNKKVLLMDTGATEDENQFSIYKAVRKLIEWEKSKNSEVELIVAHTHNHDDYTAGDLQFKNKPNTMIIKG